MREYSPLMENNGSCGGKDTINHRSHPQKNIQRWFSIKRETSISAMASRQ